MKGMLGSGDSVVTRQGIRVPRARLVLAFAFSQEEDTPADLDHT